MQRIKIQYFFLGGLLVFFMGCSGVIAPELVQQVQKNPSVQAVQKSPVTHVGQMVIWAGEIIEARNEKEGTCLQMLEKPSDASGRPKDEDTSGGRFLAIYHQYLDTAIYEKGRKVTIAGKIQGIRVLSLGGIEYSYPVIQVEQLHLWPETKTDCFCPPKPWIGFPYWYYWR